MQRIGRRGPEAVAGVERRCRLVRACTINARTPMLSAAVSVRSMASRSTPRPTPAPWSRSSTPSRAGTTTGTAWPACRARAVRPRPSAPPTRRRGRSSRPPGLRSRCRTSGPSRPLPPSAHGGQATRRAPRPCNGTPRCGRRARAAEAARRRSPEDVVAAHELAHLGHGARRAVEQLDELPPLVVLEHEPRPVGELALARSTAARTTNSLTDVPADLAPPRIAASASSDSRRFSGDDRICTDIVHTRRSTGGVIQDAPDARRPEWSASVAPGPRSRTARIPKARANLRLGRASQPVLGGSRQGRLAGEKGFGVAARTQRPRRSSLCRRHGHRHRSDAVDIEATHLRDAPAEHVCRGRRASRAGSSTGSPARTEGRFRRVRRERAEGR
jgi:hypothetical protein